MALCLLLALVATSCSDKDVTYQMTEVDESAKAYVQIGYIVPVSNVAANYIYYIGLNDVEYGNDGSTFLATYNLVPSGGVARYYTVDAGTLQVTLKGKSNDIVYSGAATGLEAGQHYVIWVYDLNSAPAVTVASEVPRFAGSSETATHCSVRFYNFLYEEDGTPFRDKLQYAIRNDSTNVYEPIGEAVAFGEGTDYFTPTIIKTVYNSSGYQRRYVTLMRIDAQTGENLGQLTYTTSSGKKDVLFTDYWTWYIGRAYMQFVGGIRTSKSVPLRLSSFTAL